jgi:hypothetical protein
MLWQEAEDVKFNDTVCVFHKSEGKINQKRDEARQKKYLVECICASGKKSHTLDPLHHHQPVSFG